MWELYINAVLARQTRASRTAVILSKSQSHQCSANETPRCTTPYKEKKNEKSSHGQSYSPFFASYAYLRVWRCTARGLYKRRLGSGGVALSR